MSRTHQQYRAPNGQPLWLWMFRLNYLGVRNSQTYRDGPKFYVPPRKGPWLRFLRWLQVIPPKRLTVGDVAKILDKKPFE